MNENELEGQMARLNLLDEEEKAPVQQTHSRTSMHPRMAQNRRVQPDPELTPEPAPAPAPRREEEEPLRISDEELNELGIPVREPQPTQDDDSVRLTNNDINRLGIPVREQSGDTPATEGRADDAALLEESRPGYTKFTTDIYKGMNFEDASQLYDQIVDEPTTTKGPAGLFTFQTDPDTGERNFILPPSYGLLGSDSDTRASDIAFYGMFDALGNGLEFAGALIDKTGITENATDSMGNAIPGVNTGGSGTDALIAEGVPILASSVIGAGLAWRATQGANLLVRGGTSYLASETAAAAASPSDSPSIAIGENAMLPILRGVDLEDSNANDVVEARLNLLADGLVSGGVLARALQNTARLGSFAYGLAIKPLVDVFFKGRSGTESEAITRVLRQLSDAMEGQNVTDPQVAFEVQKRVTDIIEQNKEVFARSLREVDKDLKITLDSMSALNRGLPEGEQGRLRQVLEGLRSGRTQQPGSQTLDAANRPGRTLQAETQGRIEDVGGATAGEQTATMRRSADELAEQGRREVQESAGSVRAAEEELDRSANQLIADLANDVEMSEDIRRLTSATGTEIDTTRAANRNEVLSRVREGYEEMRRGKNARYDAIDGGPIDVGSMYDALGNVNLDELSRQSTSLQRQSPIRQIVELFQPRTVRSTGASTDLTLGGAAGDAGRGATRQETKEEVVERVQDFFDRNPDTYNFGYFNNVIRPELSTIANDLFQKNETMAGRAVRDIVRTIDEDMVDYVGRTDPQLADAATEAKRYYREEFAPLFRDGPLKRYSELYESTVGRNENIGQVDFASGSRRLADQTVAAADPDEIGQFVNLLRRSEAGGDPDPIAQYMVADSISSAADTLRASGGTDFQIGAYVGKLRQYSAALRENFPERAAELDTFAREVEGLQGNRTALQSKLDEAKASFEEIVENVRNGELKSFFRRNYQNSNDPVLKNLATASDPQEAFKKLFRGGTDTSAKVTAVMDRIADAPADSQRVIRDGLETAYLREFRDQILGRRRESGDMRSVLAAKIEENMDEVRSLFNVGDIIYRDAPEIMESTRLLADLASGVSFSRNATPVSSMSPTEFNRQVTTASNRLIYTIIGPLSRTGTRVRASVGAGLQKFAPDEQASIVMDRILADPEYFVRLSRKYNKRPSDPVARERLINALIPAEVRSQPDESKESESRVGNFMQGAADTESSVRNTVSDQMERLNFPGP